MKQADGNLVGQYLASIDGLFRQEEQLSRPYTVGSQTEVERSEVEKHSLVKTANNLPLKHGGGSTPSIPSRVCWAIRQRQFERLVANISAQVADLENIIPTQEMERHLDQMRSEDATEIKRTLEVTPENVDLFNEVAQAVD
ncbi:hypothetical protein B0H67DRAFT_648190 [Lasiosphaeris hirsuta]|uniref:Prion-inhibition and propagation HeLo domain-containing protein n=1 Tax=Lasiosphaeris hirsuta TaxID=260670 RepID=A0AA40A2N2_9PEZI|nr:hypothetical protein B0H67DRAFT_648190 [Lasiosphaeris hirsuta]